MSDNLLILNKTRKGMFDPQTGHYRWHEDFYEKYTYRMCHFSQARSVNSHPGADIKIPWETSRMQYLFSLALAFRATGEEKYAAKIKRIILDFMACNDYNEGPNWNVSMEVGIRAANVILAAELIQDSAAFDEAFYKQFCLFVYSHQKHIFSNLENIGGKTSNHFLGNLLGLASAAAACPFLPGMERVQKYVIDSLHFEIAHQIQKDGSDFEGSTSYQRLVGEILCFAILAAEQFGFVLTDEEKRRLEAMACFECAIRMPNGLVPQIGDNDSGRVFQLTEEETCDHSSCVNLLLSLSAGAIMDGSIPDGFACFWKDGTGREKWKPVASKIKQFGDFGVLRFSGDRLYLFFTAGTPENKGMSGHTHNDLLSFCLSVGTDVFISDPGSGEYTGHPDIRNELRSTASHATVKIGSAEQRQMLPDSLFQWYSRCHAALSHSEMEDGYFLIGEYGQGKEETLLKRQIRISKDESVVEIEDSVAFQNAYYTMCLPVHPDIRAEEKNGAVILHGKQSDIVVSGTWKMKTVKGMYSTQYHEIVQQVNILCKSDKHKNVLKIEIVHS